MKKLVIVLIICAMAYCSYAQENLPTDYLTKEFHAGRRDALRQLMPANSVAVIFSNPERNFSNDVDFPYHQNPDMYYFSGYNEPDAVLLIFKETQHVGDSSYNELFFVRKRDPLREQWTGRRLGADGVKAQLGFTNAYEGSAFINYPIDFGKFSTVMYDELPADVRNTSTPGDLFSLVKTFKKKANVPDITDPDLYHTRQLIARYSSAYSASVLVDRLIKPKMLLDEAYRNDPDMQELVNKPDSITLIDVAKKIHTESGGTALYSESVAMLREVKTPEELALLRKSVKLSSIAHAEVMRAITPGMSERELEGIFTYVHQKYGAEAEGYPPIVGAGANGCILHYEENTDMKIDNQLVLMDVGAEYHGYSADVTRTVPSNGKFTPEQRAIYQLVYDAQDSIFQLCKEGIPFMDLNNKAKQVLAAGLIKLGIITDASEVAKYYPHGCSHRLGLDVHDKGSSRLLRENEPITVEPGIYIPANSPCDKKWWNIGVRIEDDVNIEKNGFELLSIDAPRSVDAVEKMVAEKSLFNEFALPPL